MNDTKPFGVEITLSDVCTNITYGYTASATSENTGVKFLRITDIVPSRIDWESVPFCKISPSDLDKYQIREGDIVIARTGATTGYNKTIKQLPYPAVYASYLIKYDLDRFKADSAFVGYVLQASNWYEYVDAIAGGSAQPGANAKQLGSYPFILPAIPEQKAIASVLSSLDDKIDLLHRQNKTLEAMAETLFRQWFIEEAKEDWLTVQVKDIVKQIKPGTNYQPKRLESGIPFLNVRNLKNGQIDLQGISFISQEEYERVHKAWKPEVGDVLISRIGTLGIVAVLGKRDMPMAVHYNMLVLKPNLTNKAFLYFLLRSQYFQDLYSSKARQSVQEYVAVEDAEAIELKLPLNDADFVKKQEQFSDLFNKIRANLAQIQTLEKLRDTLLPKLMSGEVRVQYQTEEVA